MRQYNCVNGQSLSDVCLNTYGTMNKYVKMLNDNGLSPNDVPNTGQIIMWDETQVLDQSTQSVINANKTIYATLLGYGTPEQVNPISKMYKDTLNVSYTATDPAGETLITITALQNNEVIQIQKEIKPLLDSQYIFNSSNGTIQLVGVTLEQDETVFVLYKKIISI